jgi:Na+-driven multidrug efflux pump
MSSFVSQNACAGKEDRAKKAMFTGMGIGVIAGIIMFGIILLAGKNLCGLFSTNQSVIEKGYQYLSGFASEAIVTGVLFSFNGHQKSFWVMLQGVLQTMIVRLPMAYIMSVQPHASLTMIGLASPCATTFGIVINVIYYMHTLKLEPVQQSVHA